MLLLLNIIFNRPILSDVSIKVVFSSIGFVVSGSIHCFLGTSIAQVLTNRLRVVVIGVLRNCSMNYYDLG